jgi:hypothetical protein
MEHPTIEAKVDKLSYSLGVRLGGCGGEFTQLLEHDRLWEIHRPYHGYSLLLFMQIQFVSNVAALNFTFAVMHDAFTIHRCA